MIDLRQLSANTVLAFKTTLQTQLKTIPDLTTIETSDYDVYKVATTDAIEDSDISGTPLTIKTIPFGVIFPT